MTDGQREVDDYRLTDGHQYGYTLSSYSESGDAFVYV